MHKKEHLRTTQEISYISVLEIKVKVIGYHYQDTHSDNKDPFDQ